jgi:hypothetical protein
VLRAGDLAGSALDRLLSLPPARRWATAAVGAAFGYTLLYAATVDVLMVGDSRYAAERWMRARAWAATN